MKKLISIFAFIVLTIPGFADVGAQITYDTPFTISVTHDGTPNATPPPFNYQWKKDGVNIAGATSATYRVANAKTADSGIYSVSVTNYVGSVVSDLATILVTAPPTTVPPTQKPPTKATTTITRS